MRKELKDQKPRELFTTHETFINLVVICEIRSVTILTIKLEQGRRPVKLIRHEQNLKKMEDKGKGNNFFLQNRMKLSFTRGSLLWNIFLTLVLCSISKGRAEATFNPCEGNSGMYCECDSTGSLWEVKDAKCRVYNRINSEWDAIERMTGLESLIFHTRDKQFMRSFIPSKVFQQMSNLSYFNMKLGSIERVPSYAFANSSSLRDVALESNEIFFLDRHSFANMKSLQIINLKENFILEINRSVFSNLPQLRQLFLDRNHIRVLHDFAFSELSALEELDLKGNNLTVIARDAFANLSSLRRLELQYNSIELLGDHVFADMPNLEDLELMKNKIIHVHPNAFAGLHKLGWLSLKENKIVELKHWTFSSLRSLYFLDLRQNELETMEEELVTPIYSNLKNVSFQLHLEGNRFVCDCRILWIQELLNVTQSNYIQYNLKNIECNFFQRHSTHPARSRKGHGGHNYEHSTMGSLSYVSNVTMVAVAPEETTALADFDSTRKVIKLDPTEMDCQEDRVTKLVSVSTPYPPTFSSGVLNPAPSSTDSPVLIKKHKHKKPHHHGEQGDQAERANLNPSQSSRSSAHPSDTSSAGSGSRIQVNSHYLVTWLMTVAVFVLSLSLAT
ncbi:unnamed protein product [Allacma fusca]|uniref:Connectin n=1 Tax=Allacma fusca TaxID=39272 RepID=A0A8J2P0U6_9HEXA|nr:unnamed protein product [Allacma fusca]